MSKLVVRLVIGLVFALFGLLNYFTNVSDNPITGESQRIQLTPQQEVVLGQQASQEMAAEYGGLYPDQQLQAYVDQVGQAVVQQSEASQSPYPFEFYLLRDLETVNAFALPGGQIFITAALLGRLENEAQLAGVLGHEVGHVVARHGAEHLARQQLGALLVNVVGITVSDSPDQARQAAILAQAVNQLVNLRYGREDELESDRLGFQFMVEAGYTPEGIVELMAILNQASSGGSPPEFLSTHPNPDNRIERLEALISEEFPNGIPPELEEGDPGFAQTIRPRLR
ncbi:MAG: M48 family metalloprotease [Leptolyngbyaceae cyanobacterium SM1_1_3]|nr:M48 family metalloprotease [Leptolyngbyaceae cyanobacterium SM1_1_3]NJN02419.1 M48 family metalloprotease [Leptolyngbyaceae cyanobacterium RM1_1_2]NJO11089.1 M48 family metalloprotease [Leptolyngbyaceae cyanobacterium SL_1_1]